MRVEGALLGSKPLRAQKPVVTKKVLRGGVSAGSASQSEAGPAPSPSLECRVQETLRSEALLGCAVSACAVVNHSAVCSTRKSSPKRTLKTPQEHFANPSRGRPQRICFRHFGNSTVQRLRPLYLSLPLPSRSSPTGSLLSSSSCAASSTFNP